jgi:DNA polymerase-3 subunit gamma/tau
LIAQAAQGSMRDALSLTDQAVAYGNQVVNEADVRSMLGAIDQRYLFDIVNALINEDGASLIAKAQEMESRSISFEAALHDLAKILHQIAIAQAVPETISPDLPERDRLLQLAQTLSAEQLQLYYQIALLGSRDIGLAPDEYAGFTMSLLRMLAFSPADSLSAQKKNSVNPISKVATPFTENVIPIYDPAASQDTNAQTEAMQTAVESISVEAVIDPPERQSEETDALTHDESTLFDGNWRKLVELHLKLGIARALAQNCEMLSYDEDSITLRVAEKQKHLVSATYQEKLSSAINVHFGKKIKLHFQIDSEANTPAKEQAEEKAIIQSTAEEAIMNDAFVQALMHDFDAKIIPNSIKPAT